MKIWTVEEEASALRARFAGVNRAAFARDHQLKGGQAMIYQHITGRRPISIEAAMAYAAGFGCSLAEISPRLAAEAQKAAALTSESGASEVFTPPLWPFSAAYRKYEALTASDKARLDAVVSSFIESAEVPKPARARA